MKFSSLLTEVEAEPVFETGLLLVGGRDPADVRRQLSRWVEAGRLLRLRRGLYALAPPYRKVRPHPFLVANRMVEGSYVSLQSALAHYGLIPESVPVTTSVGLERPRRWVTPLGSFLYRQIKPALYRGYRREEVTGQQQAFLATPEKALLDLLYLEPEGDSLEYLGELRLQNLETLDAEQLRRQAALAEKPKLRRAAERVIELRAEQTAEYVSL